MIEISFKENEQSIQINNASKIIDSNLNTIALRSLVFFSNLFVINLYHSGWKFAHFICLMNEELYNNIHIIISVYSDSFLLMHIHLTFENINLTNKSNY